MQERRGGKEKECFYEEVKRGVTTEEKKKKKKAVPRNLPSSVNIIIHTFPYAFYQHPGIIAGADTGILLFDGGWLAERTTHNAAAADGLWRRLKMTTTAASSATPTPQLCLICSAGRRVEPV